MPVTKDNTSLFKSEVSRMFRMGITAAAAEGAERYQAELSKNTHPEYPSGPFKDEETSDPGEYPYRRTGQAADENVWFEVTQDGRTAGFGVYGQAHGTNRFPNSHRGGMHVIYLTGEGRLGPIDTYRDYREQIAAKFRESAR